MPGEVGAIKDAMRDAFVAAGIPELEIYRGVPTSMHLPCLCIGEVQITPSRTFGTSARSGMEEMTLTLSVFTSTADDQDGQNRLDELISRDQSVRQVLWAMRGAPGQAALGGLVDDIYLFDISGYGMISVGDNGALYGANLSVRVIVS
jgi:hypothetical protein